MCSIAMDTLHKFRLLNDYSNIIYKIHTDIAMLSINAYILDSLLGFSTERS
jgi:hypothetical protein